jgi:hypothetical protein
MKKRVTLITHPDLLPANAMWIVNDHEGSLTTITPTPEQVGQPIQQGKMAIAPTRKYERKPVTLWQRIAKLMPKHTCQAVYLKVAKFTNSRAAVK